MKYFVIFLVLFTVSLLSVNHAYGIWIPQSQEELLEESQVIVVGNITSVKELELEQPIPSENSLLVLDQYTVTVEEFVKNPQNTDTITVRQPTISTPGRLLPHGGFEIGDRVLFYIESFDGINTYSKESFLIPKQCDTSSVIHEPRIIGSDYIMIQNGIEKRDNFTANLPIQFVAKSDMNTLSGARMEYDVYISKQVGKIYKDIVFNQTITADAKPCEWLSVAEWAFTPDAGNYLLNGRVYKVMSNFSISNQFFSVLAESPLKQFRSGVPVEEIQCNDDLVLLQKHNGSPACVKPDSVIDLIKRNWMTTEDVGGYAIDYDGDVKHLPFADICSNEMKIILLTQSNIALPDEKFVIDDVNLPSGMNQEDFERCALETSFTKSRWNMVDNPPPKSITESTQKWKIPVEKMGCTDAMIIHLKKYSNAFDEKWNGKSVAIEDIGLPWGVHQYALDECMQNISELRNNEN